MQVTVGLHDRTVTISTAEACAAGVIDFVCAALERRIPDERTVALQLQALTDETEAAETLMADLVQALVWDYAGGLALHAGAVERGGRAVLFAATSGTGKSTLVVHLAANGWRFLTDELVFVPRDTLQAHALARPAHLKPGSMFVLDEQLALVDGPGVRRYRAGALLAPSVFAVEVAPPLPMGAIVFPRYTPNEAPRLERLAPGPGAFALLAALVNARNLDGDGIPEIARVAGSVPTYRLSYDKLSDGRALLDTIAL